MCEYCNKDFNNRDVIETLNGKRLSVFVAKQAGYKWVLQATNDWDNTIRPINYCPMCGRKLDLEIENVF